MPETACLMLTSYADDDALFAAIMAGAAGYVLKQIGGMDLVADIARSMRVDRCSIPPCPRRSWSACDGARRKTSWWAA